MLISDFIRDALTGVKEGIDEANKKTGSEVENIHFRLNVFPVMYETESGEIVYEIHARHHFESAKMDVEEYCDETPFDLSKIHILEFDVALRELEKGFDFQVRRGRIKEGE